MSRLVIEVDYGKVRKRCEAQRQVFRLVDKAAYPGNRLLGNDTSLTDYCDLVNGNKDVEVLDVA